MEFAGALRAPQTLIAPGSTFGEQANAASSDDVAAFMEQREFTAIPGVSAGRYNSISYFRPSDQVAVFDTHGQNFLVSGQDTVPIDALIIYASEYLAEYLTMTADERIAEIGH